MSWLLSLGVIGLTTGLSGPAEDGDALIRALAPEVRAELLKQYEHSAWVFSKALKFQRPPAIFLSCPGNGCDPSATTILADLQRHAPATLGARVPDRDAAQIEIYVAPQPQAAEARSRQLDDKLRLDVNTTSRRFLHLAEDAPCWTVTYFHKSGVIEKAMIYIDSDSSSKMQHLCAGFETIRATGVLSLDGVLFYRKAEKRRLRNPLRWLILNAHLHGLKAIGPGDSIERVHAVLQDRYGTE